MGGLCLGRAVKRVRKMAASMEKDTDHLLLGKVRGERLYIFLAYGT